MTLTPEDVLNKNFTPTQFRRGYDEREVDDFLDEVVTEMRRIVKDYYTVCDSYYAAIRTATPDIVDRSFSMVTMSSEAKINNLVTN